MSRSSTASSIIINVAVILLRPIKTHPLRPRPEETSLMGAITMATTVVVAIIRREVR
jgi:hypothetical protein